MTVENNAAYAQAVTYVNDKVDKPARGFVLKRVEANWTEIVAKAQKQNGGGEAPAEPANKGFMFDPSALKAMINKEQKALADTAGARDEEEEATGGGFSVET